MKDSLSEYFESCTDATGIDFRFFDLNNITPTTLGSIFQESLDSKRRREFGVHYTNEKNIKKIIDELFLNRLYQEYESSRHDYVALCGLHEKVSGLTFLDPACGCGNFLIVTYKELRKLELEILRSKVSLSSEDVYSKVSVSNFYGIEIDSIPCRSAIIGLMLMEQQMNGVFEKELRISCGSSSEFNIVCENALTINWETIIEKENLSYIIGNPPFIGARVMTKEQKKELISVFNGCKGSGDLDYVTCWFKKASEYIQGTNIEVVFVSTNSICQGAQVPILWKLLFEDFGICINFAFRSFKWDGDTKGKAMVHCVIVCFVTKNRPQKVLFENENQEVVENINPYLLGGNDIFVEPHKFPLCKVPEMRFGNQPRDGGNFILSEEEYDNVIKDNPELKDFILPYVGANEFINNKRRYCIWLHNAPKDIVEHNSFLQERIEKVKNFRITSKAKTTNGYAKVPSIFAQIAHPYTDYLIVPSVSSENRKYIPIGFLSKNIIASDAVQIVPNATLYHFGIITSSVHMTWMREIAGRLEMSYRYSKELVYNTFPWAVVSKEQEEVIKQLSQDIIDIRSLFSDKSLAYLYNPETMPKDLQNAHERLDKCVMELYNYRPTITEDEIVNDLMKRYKGLTSSNSPCIEKFIVDEQREKVFVENINGYLIDAPNIFVRSRSKPLSDVPLMNNGNVPLDGGALIIEEEDYEKFKDCHYVKRLIGARELLHNEKRYVLWLVDVPYTDITKYPEVCKRVELCRSNRLAMKDKATQKLAETPTTFRETSNPEKYIAIPRVSSENRVYIPMDYFGEDDIAGDGVHIIPDGTYYNFGILTSVVHMAWMRAVAGRLKSDYRYSKDIVYNNFPWCIPTQEQILKVEELTRNIFGARALFPSKNLAELYNDKLMPKELKDAHKELDNFVLELYGYEKSITEKEIVLDLMKRYQKLIENEKRSLITDFI